MRRNKSGCLIAILSVLLFPFLVLKELLKEYK